MGRRSIKSISRRGTCNLSNEEALFYLSMPEKVRRLHFTREENILIRAACELQLAKHPRFENVFPPQQASLDGRASTSHSHASTLVNRDAMLDHGHSSPDSAMSDVRRPSSTRNFSYPQPRAYSVVSTNSSILPFNPLACHPPGSSSGPKVSHSQLDNTRITTDATNPAKKQYLDPQTRSKIRQYLASSEAFDEVLTFGFPADEDETAADAFKAFNQPEENTIVSDDSSDDSYVNDDNSATDTDDGPLTPGSDNTLATSFDYRSPYLERQDSDSFRTHKRQMTLRVTLTKPEHRSAVDTTPPHSAAGSKRDQVSVTKADPLALEALTYSDDVTGMNGAFAVTPTRTTTRDRRSVRQLFRKFQRSSTAAF